MGFFLAQRWPPWKWLVPQREVACRLAVLEQRTHFPPKQCYMQWWDLMFAIKCLFSPFKCWAFAAEVVKAILMVRQVRWCWCYPSVQLRWVPGSPQELLVGFRGRASFHSGGWGSSEIRAGLGVGGTFHSGQGQPLCPPSSSLLKNTEVRFGAVPELALNQVQCVMKECQEQGQVLPCETDRNVLRVCWIDNHASRSSGCLHLTFIAPRSRFRALSSWSDFSLPLLSTLQDRIGSYICFYFWCSEYSLPLGSFPLGL